MSNGNGNSNHSNGNGHSTRGPKTPEGRARALANLIPAKPGEVRNPKGRPNAGASVREWWNQMEGWPRAKLKAVIDDQESSVAKVAAAQRWLDGCTSGNELERIIEHTGGRPQQSIDLTSNGDSLVKVISGVSMSEL